MAPELRVTDVCDSAGRIVAPQWLAAAETVHRQLRPNLPADYAAKMARVFAGGGRMTVAADGASVAGLAVWRVFEDTHNGVRLYVDDLVTDEARRSRGVGHALIEALETRARAAGAVLLSLDSGTQRTRSHAFYFREGLRITSFNFKKSIS